MSTVYTPAMRLIDGKSCANVAVQFLFCHRVRTKSANGPIKCSLKLESVQAAAAIQSDDMGKSFYILAKQNTEEHRHNVSISGEPSLLKKTVCTCRPLLLITLDRPIWTTIRKMRQTLRFECFKTTLHTGIRVITQTNNYSKKKKNRDERTFKGAGPNPTPSLNTELCL